jgi:hypothetical protein
MKLSPMTTFASPKSPALPSEVEMARAGRHSLVLNIGVIFLVMSTVLYILSITVADPDLWGHIKFGEDLWQTGKIIQSDPYSYLSGDRLWINHEWLAEAIFYLGFALTGPAGLIVLKVAVGLLIAGLVYRHLCRQGLTPLRAGIVLLPVTPLLVPGLLLLIYQAEHGRPQYLWLAPPLFALWVNLHGGFLAGLGILLLWFFTHLAFVLLRARQPRALSLSKLAMPVAVSVLATLLNPYGVELLVFLLRTATVARPDITEWRPIVIMTPLGAMYIAILGVAVAALVYSRRERCPALITLFVCASLLPLMAVRHTQLFALVVAVLAGEHIGDAWGRVSSGRQSNRSAAGANGPRPWLAGLSLIGAVVLVGLALPNFSCIRPYPVYARRAIALLKQSGVSGNLAVHFTWGEYAIWHLSPGIKVSVDGRRETVYSDEIRRENLDFRMGTGDWDALLSKHETNLALVSKKFPVFNLMQLKPDWILVYEDSVSGLFVQRGSPLVEQIQETDPPALANTGAGVCFP